MQISIQKSIEYQFENRFKYSKKVSIRKIIDFFLKNCLRIVFNKNFWSLKKNVDVNFVLNKKIINFQNYFDCRVNLNKILGLLKLFFVR